jgi:class 3 adenylate cyclase/tetratricopeptide (TPR) repeat protein
VGPVDLTAFVPRLLLGRSPTASRHWQVDATMAFIDISGFTSLSEQLSRRGRVGAEDLVSTLTRIFTLLMSATDDGGDVVKFAGDALLVMYDGPDHELHACHAAHAAQRLLDVVGSVRLAGAKARLRMSVGVHTGRFDLMLTGRTSQNLVVAGPELDTLLALEGVASAGQVVVSERTAASLPSSAAGAGVDGGVLLKRMTPVEAVGLASAPAPHAGQLARFLPSAFGARPDLLRADSDHRRTAMAFVQAGGLNEVLLGGAPLAVVDEVSDVVEEACAEHGVTLLDTDIAPDGYRYFLTAGAPHTVEDPEGRLLRTLVRITSAQLPLTLRAGASSGRVFAGPVGASFRRTYSVMGDTTNLAARLTARAPSGGVLVQASVLDRSATDFSTVDHDPVRVKGKADEIAVRVVTAVGAQRTRDHDERAFVGREHELALLRERLDGVRLGRGAAIEIVGEAGLGKTRLAHEAAAVDGLAVMHIETDPYGAHVPHRTLARLLRPLLGLGDGDDLLTSGRRLRETVERKAPDLLRWLPLLAPAVRAEVAPTTAVSELDDRFRAARYRDAVRGLLAAVLPVRTVVVVDDAQWVDPTSADAMAAAFAAPESPPWGLLMTRRDEERGLRGHDSFTTTVLRLEPLPKKVARRLVAAEAELRGAQVDAVVDRADGNPYFLLELVASRNADLPDSIEDLVALRIDRLSGEDRDLLRQAAVLGSRFPAALFAETTGLGDVAASALGPGLDEFLAVGSDGTIAFRREVHREVAYEQLTFRRRREAHRKAATAIERSPELASGARLQLLSLHSYAAGAWPEAYRWSRDASRAARDEFATDAVVVFAQRALEAGRRTGAPAEQLRELWLTLGEVLTLTGQHDEAVRAYGQARRGLSAPEDVAPIVVRVGNVRREEGRYDAALRAARQIRTLAATCATPDDERLAAEADLLAAGVRYWQGRSALSRSLSLSAAEHAEQLGLGHERTRLLARAYALHDTAVVELEGRAGQYDDLPIQMFAEIGDLYNQGRFSVNLAYGLFYEGDWDRAVRMYLQSLDLAERIGDVFSVAVAQMNIAEVLAQQGKAAEAVELLGESIATLRALHTALAQAHAECFLGDALRLTGDLASAEAALTASAASFERAGRASGFPVDELTSRRVELLVDQGRSQEAVDVIGTLLDRADPPAPLHCARVLRSRAMARRRLGDDLAAAADLDAGIEVARELPLGYDAALSLLVRAKWTGSDTDRAEAAELLGRLGAEALLQH